MKIALLLLVAVLATSAMATWSSCGDGTLTLSNVVINPEPIVRGKNVSFTVSGNLAEEVTGGTVALSVTYLGVNVFSHSYDICAQAEFPCPIAAGPYSASQSLPFPSFPPKGTYKGQLKMTDNTGKLIACIAFSESVEVEAPTSQKLIHDADFIAEINKKANGLWVAAPSKKFHGMTFADARKFLGAKLDGPKPKKSARSLPIGSIPASFTWQGDQCLGAIRDQQQCGSCWAFSATEALADRFCIKSKGAVKVVLSPEDLVSCDQNDSGCDGGYLTSAWDYLTSSGAVTEQCFPYTAGSGTAPACRSTCANGQPWTKYKAAKGTVVQPSTVSAIQTEIMSNGPVQAAFTVYADFFNYKSGVYSYTSGAEEGGHAIKIVGWGVTSTNVPYWIVANSWGTSWGQNGFFWIKRGSDECGIESNVIAGIAAVSA